MTCHLETHLGSDLSGKRSGRTLMPPGEALLQCALRCGGNAHIHAVVP